MWPQISKPQRAACSKLSSTQGMKPENAYPSPDSASSTCELPTDLVNESITAAPAAPSNPVAVDLTQPSKLAKRRRGRPRKIPAVSLDMDEEIHTPTKRTRASPGAAIPTPAKSAAPTAVDLGADTTKRARLRIRNREAAHKCRQRKQRGVEDLQTQEAVVETVHASLVAEAAQLRGNVLVLKNMVMQHGGCGCDFIEKYIHSAAFGEGAINLGMDVNSGVDMNLDMDMDMELGVGVPADFNGPGAGAGVGTRVMPFPDGSLGQMDHSPGLLGLDDAQGCGLISRADDDGGAGGGGMPQLPMS